MLVLRHCESVVCTLNYQVYSLYEPKPADEGIRVHLYSRAMVKDCQQVCNVLETDLVRVRLYLHDVLFDLFVSLDARLRLHEGNVLVAHLGGVEPLVEGQPSVRSELAASSLRAVLLR